MADSTAECWCRARTNAGAVSRSRSAAAVPAFFGQGHQVQSRFQCLAIRRTMEAFIETDTPQPRKARSGAVDHADGYLVVCLFCHNLMMENETMLVFKNADPHAQLDRNAGLAFADPFRVRLEDREDLLVMGDLFAGQDPPPNLVDLTFGMRPVAVQ